MTDTYVYDGDFFSLIVLVVELIYRKESVGDIKTEEDYVPNLLSNLIKLEIENKDKKLKYIKNKLSKNVLNCMYYVYLSSNTNKEMIIYNFIKYYFKYNDKVFFYRHLDCVNASIKISGYVSREAHKLKGFLRFKEMRNNFLYAEMSPTNNVIGILANHFSKRLKNECWIIKDQRRDLYALYDTVRVTFLTGEDVVKLNLDLNNNEEFIEDLWKTFFKTIAIKERENLRCQMNFMPKKYWNNIIEMEDKV